MAVIVNSLYINALIIINLVVQHFQRDQMSHEV